MSILRWLFRPSGTMPGRRVDLVPARGAPKLDLRDLRGLRSPSPDGRYCLVYSDGDRTEDRSGWYALVDDGRVITSGTAHRPNDGKVSNAGNFIFNDWDRPDQLCGWFRAHRPDGTPIISKAFSANLFNNGISDDGRLACCQTANAPSRDGGILTTFDLASGREIGCFVAESGWARRYEFLADMEGLRLVYRDGAYAYALTGAFLERERWVADGLNRGDLCMVKRRLAETAGRPDADLACRLLTAIDVGLAHRDWRDNHYQALGWKLRGEIEEAEGKLDNALASYEKALALEPKIGVKRRADRLKKDYRAPHC